VENHQQCQSYRSDNIRQADWLISTPTIHLRYFLEEWIDLLLNWVKYFFVEDMYFCIRQEMPNYEKCRALFESTVEQFGLDVARKTGLRLLLESFESAVGACEQSID
jgi:hypothetical protein